MARPLRIEYAGALYHVTSRGNAREPIFHDDDDRQTFLALLGEVITRFGWMCHAYCLMGNHYHLLLETPDPNLSLGMRHLNGVYTQRFNRRHSRVGHVFQGRFKAILVEKDSYLLELARYIVLNPVRAGMVKDAALYPWSSYRATAGGKCAPAWLTTASILGLFAKTDAVARRRYCEFVAQGMTAGSPWPMLKGQILLGGEAFAAQMQPLLEGAADSKEVPRTQRWAHRPTLRTMFIKPVRADKLKRDEAIRCAYNDYGYTMAAIARELGLHYSTVSKVIKGER
ncbi:REP-associated tyrosine transposase [Sulfurivermis fontis]|uniref:REP-associated tyrosine transposase n=1 Tax=Sulfurivermis fontis TaxID=1972068 RepID=UPI000FDAA97E|nr:transposase [Sulfurivermis fontis]